MEASIRRARRRQVDVLTGTLARLGVRARLALLVAGSTLVWGGLASLSQSPWIFADELIYVDLARSLADGGEPSVRGVATYGYGLLYPALIAPVWAIASDASVVYALARWLDALVMSLAAVPAYLLARRFTSPGSAFVVALLAVLVPSMVYAATLMTEVVLYPVFLLAVWLVARAVERPTAGAQVLVLAGIALAGTAKVLAIALLPAYLIAVLLLATLDRLYDHVSLRSSLARFRVTWALLGAGAFVLLLGTVTRGASPLAGFGAYESAVREVDVSTLPLGVLRHLGALSLYTAVAPLAATALVVVLGLRRRAERVDRVFAALAVSSVGCTVGAVAVFAAYASSLDYQSTGVPAANPLYERNVFLVVPVLLVGLAVWMERGLPRPRRLAGAVVAGCVLLVLVHPWSELPETPNPQNLAPTIWRLMPGDAWLVAVAAGIMCALGALLWLRVEPQRVSRLWVLVGTWFAVVGLFSVAMFTGVSAEAARLGKGERPDWIDRAVPAGESVAVVWDESRSAAFATPDKSQRAVWVNELFNESIGTVYALGARLPFGLPDVSVSVARGGGLVAENGAPVVAGYVFARCALGIDAPRVAVERELGVAVYRTGGLVRVSPGARASAC